MKRAWKISNAAASRQQRPSLPFTLIHTRSPIPLRVIHAQTQTQTQTQTTNEFVKPSVNASLLTELKTIFDLNHPVYEVRARELVVGLDHLKDELIKAGGEDEDKVFEVLRDLGSPLFQRFSSQMDSIFLRLMGELRSSPYLALKVFDWRRKYAEADMPLTSEEYAKAISLAGRTKNVDLAVELFTEASNCRLKKTTTYNALMGAYMYNGLANKCQSLFRALVREKYCSPTIVTYNILLSLFGRSMLIDHMEETFREIKNMNLTPNLSTYNHIIAGYLTAWMWDKMEETFSSMNACPVRPNSDTYLLMLRGYALSGNLEKMEEIYELVKSNVKDMDFGVIRTMICAYCQKSTPDTVRKVEALSKLIPADEYRPWLNILLIRFYARLDMLEAMENLINEAFERKTTVKSRHVMNAIITAYYRFDAPDKLADFVKRAECSGWRICRSLYHCKMVMYASQKRCKEMESVLNEMDNSYISRTKKSYVILYLAYSTCGPKYKVEQVVGSMLKLGFGNPLDTVPS